MDIINPIESIVIDAKSNSSIKHQNKIDLLATLFNCEMR